MTIPTPTPVEEERYNFTEVTEGTLNGNGLFDLLMASTKVHLEEEFTNNRIRGKEYADVYLGGIQAVLQNTIQYLVGNALTKEQRIKLESENELVQIEIDKGKAAIALTEVETAKAQYELTYIFPLQKSKLEAEVTLLTTQNLNEYYKYTYLLPLEKELLTANITKANSEVALLIAQTNDVNYKVNNLYPKELEKATAEIALINARTVSENSQLALNNAQVSLLEKQKEGFLRDAEQKLAKIMTDTWNTSKTVEENTQVPDYLKDNFINKIIAVSLNGVGVTNLDGSTPNPNL